MQLLACVQCKYSILQLLFLIMTTGSLGVFLVKSQRDQLLFSLSTAPDFNSPTLTDGGMDGWCLGVNVQAAGAVCQCVFMCVCACVCELSICLLWQ